jgi:hypothetical protein
MGGCLYYLLTGGDPRPLSQSKLDSGQFPTPLEQAVAGLTEMSLEKRCKSAAEFAVSLKLANSSCKRVRPSKDVRGQS